MLEPIFDLLFFFRDHFDADFSYDQLFDGGFAVGKSSILFSFTDFSGSVNHDLVLKPQLPGASAVGNLQLLTCTSTPATCAAPLGRGSPPGESQRF